MNRNRFLAPLLVAGCGTILLCLLLFEEWDSADEPVRRMVASLVHDAAGAGVGSPAEGRAIDSLSPLESRTAEAPTTLRPRVVPFDEDAERDLTELVQRLSDVAVLTRGVAADDAANVPTELLLGRKGGDTLPRLLFFVQRHGVSPHDLPSGPAMREQLETLLALGPWMEKARPGRFVRPAGIAQLALLIIAGHDAEAQALTRELRELSTNYSAGQGEWAWQYSLFGRIADRTREAGAALDQRALAVLSLATAYRDNLVGLFLTDLGATLARAGRLEDACAVLHAAASGWQPILGNHEERVAAESNGWWNPKTLRYGHPRLDLYDGWVRRELDAAGCGDHAPPWQLSILSTGGAKALQREGEGTTRLIAVSRGGYRVMEPVLIPPGDSLAPVREWLRSIYVRYPSQWPDCLDLSRHLDDGREDAVLVLRGAQTLPRNATDDLAPTDAALRRLLGDGPPRQADTKLLRDQFLAAWEPWFATRERFGEADR